MEELALEIYQIIFRDMPTWTRGHFVEIVAVFVALWCLSLYTRQSTLVAYCRRLEAELVEALDRLDRLDHKGDGSHIDIEGDVAPRRSR